MRRQKPILLESITFPQTVVSMSIEPESSDEHKKLKQVIGRCGARPNVQATINEETGRRSFPVWAITSRSRKHRLLREYKLKVRVREP